MKWRRIKSDNLLQIAALSARRESMAPELRFGMFLFLFLAESSGVERTPGV